MHVHICAYYTDTMLSVRDSTVDHVSCQEFVLQTTLFQPDVVVHSNRIQTDYNKSVSQFNKRVRTLSRWR